MNQETINETLLVMEAEQEKRLRAKTVPLFLIGKLHSTKTSLKITE